MNYIKKLKGHSIKHILEMILLKKVKNSLRM